MKFARQSWAMTTRYLRQLYRQPAFIGITLTQPLIWLLLFGALFRKITEIPGFGGGNYITYLTPGVVIMTALFNSGWSGMAIIEDLDLGIMDRFLTSPVYRSAMIVASLVYQAVTTIVQSAVIILVGWATGATFPGGASGIAVLVGAAILVALAVAALSNGLALVARQRETLIGAATMIVLPLTFLSGAFLTLRLAPGWIAAIARYNPVSWAVSAARDALSVHPAWGTVGSYVAFLAIAVVVSAALSTRAFRSYQRSI
jgi:ABC-2 type transport system permease protein